MTDWESAVFHDPDNVDADALFEDLHSDDERTQYEAAAGVYWLAYHRPERVRRRSGELLCLLGNLPEFGLGDSSSTRRWFAEAVAEVVGAYPDQFLSRMIAHLASDRETVREDAARILSVTASRTSSHEVPPQLLKHRSEFTDRLDDPNETVRTNSLWALAGIGDRYPNAVADLMPRVVPLLDRTPPETGGVVFVHRIAADSPEQAEPAIGPLVDAIGRLDADDVNASRVVLEALLSLAETYPEQIAPAERDVGRLANSGFGPVSQPATALLDVLAE